MFDDAVDVDVNDVTTVNLLLGCSAGGPVIVDVVGAAVDVVGAAVDVVGALVCGCDVTSVDDTIAVGLKDTEAFCFESLASRVRSGSLRMGVLEGCCDKSPLQEKITEIHCMDAVMYIAVHMYNVCFRKNFFEVLHT